MPEKKANYFDFAGVSYTMCERALSFRLGGVERWETFTVYILKNRDGKIYVGHTGDMVRRLEEHNVMGTGFTSKYRPWYVIYSEQYETRAEAVSRERFFKTGKGRVLIQKIITRP